MIESFIFLAFMVISITVLSTATIRMTKGHLQEWAVKNHLELQKCEYRHIKIGPYFKKQFFVGKGNFLFFRIEVKTTETTIKTGWARVGDYFFGPLFEEVDVIWD